MQDVRFDPTLLITLGVLPSAKQRRENIHPLLLIDESMKLKASGEVVTIHSVDLENQTFVVSLGLHQRTVGFDDVELTKLESHRIDMIVKKNLDECHQTNQLRRKTTYVAEDRQNSIGLINSDLVQTDGVVPSLTGIAYTQLR